MQSNLGPRKAKGIHFRQAANIPVAPHIIKNDVRLCSSHSSEKPAKPGKQSARMPSASKGARSNICFKFTLAFSEQPVASNTGSLVIRARVSGVREQM